MNKFEPFILNEQAGKVYDPVDLETYMQQGYTVKLEGYEGLYVTRAGDVFALRKNGSVTRSKEVIINGRRHVSVCINHKNHVIKTTRAVASLVAEAFHGHHSKGYYVGFGNDNPFDCSARNVHYVSSRELYVNRGNLDTTMDFLIHHDPFFEHATVFSDYRKLSEEMSEVLTAIDHQDVKNLEEELGDLLFHIKALCKLAEREGLFSYSSVERIIANKMYDRHIAPVLHPKSDIYVHPLK